MRTVTLLVPGVMHGSAGPLLWLPELVEMHPHVWNGVPLTLEHGGPMVGRVYNARIECGKLRADIPTLRERPEVSTGTEGIFVQTPGSWYGADYIGVVKSYRPEHLAILTEGTGAASAVQQFTEIEFQDYERRWR